MEISSIGKNIYPSTGVVSFFFFLKVVIAKMTSNPAALGMLVVSLNFR